VAVGYGVPVPKPIPRVIDRIGQKRALAAQERACRALVDARDQRRCFFPSCGTYASDKHHIQARSLGGKWQSFNILSACNQHHRYFKSGLIRVVGNPDCGRVKVRLTALGLSSGLHLPREVSA
jgi:hypothetical protein